jgi:3-methyladenine DNA glycosylase AlkC
MTSISSYTLIKKRTLDFCKIIEKWELKEKNSPILVRINNFFQKEYDIIPEKERIGKGAVFISRHISKAMILFLINNFNKDFEYCLALSENLFRLGEEFEDLKILHLALYLFAETIYQFPEQFDTVKCYIVTWANHKEWQIRESIGEAIIAALKKKPVDCLNYLLELTKNEMENLRRLASESLRPRADIKWLRDPSKNDFILKILTNLRMDSSIYVRKSVGNNVKDLSKYMPQKMLKLMEKWIEQSKIRVYAELATEKGLTKDQKRLVWTIKHGMRWIQKKNPEYHSKLEKILGLNYVLYFDEKKNRFAYPPKK